MANGLVINARSLSRRLTGVERYTIEISALLEKSLRREMPPRDLPPAAGHFWEQFVLPQKVRKGELLWSPANIGPVAVSKQLLTLHDTSVLEHPEWFKPLFARWYRAVLPVLVRRVRRVLTISEHSRQSILKLFRLPAEKVVAISEGVNSSLFYPATVQEITRVQQHYGLSDKYMLFLGTLEPRKNLEGLYDAWRLIQPGLRGVELIIVGSQLPHFATVHSIPAPQGVRRLGYVPDSDLSALYSGARAYLLPSLTEGFGLTALEAMACGAPVIASSAGALPETVGQAGILIDPLDIPKWACAMLDLLNDEECRQEYRQRGLERASKFSWERTAQRVLQELEAVR
jgi:glycosyltransferase involved in cell wall biosynthesis